MSAVVSIGLLTNLLTIFIYLNSNFFLTPRRKNNLIFYLVIISHVSIFSFFVITLQYHLITGVLLIFNYAFNFLYYKNTSFEKLFITTLLILISMLPPVFSALILNIFNVFNFLNSRELINTIYILSFLLVSFGALGQIFIFSLKRNDILLKLLKLKKYNIYLMSMVVFCLLLTFIPKILLMIGLNSSLYINIVMLIIIILILSNLFVLSLLVKQNYIKNVLINKQKKLSVKLDALSAEVDINKKVISDRKKIFHDIKNHNLVIKMLLQNKEYKNVLNYVEQMEEEFSKIDSKKIVNNIVVNHILLLKEEICLKNDISFNFDVELPRELSIDEYDLSTIYCNLLDNAIEENFRAQDKSKRYIYLKTRIKRDLLIIEIKNFTQKRGELAKDFFVTQKIGNHGIGLGNVKQSINKYSGDLKFEKSDSEFTVRVYIPNVSSCNESA